MIKKELIWACDSCGEKKRPTEYSEKWTPVGSLTLKRSESESFFTWSKTQNHDDKHFCNISCLYKYTLEESTKIALEDKKEQRVNFKDYAGDAIEQPLHDNPIYYANPHDSIVMKI